MQCVGSDEGISEGRSCCIGKRHLVDASIVVIESRVKCDHVCGEDGLRIALWFGGVGGNDKGV